MKVYRIPRMLKTIIFDIDGTLYTNPRYVHEQVDVQIRHFARLRGMSEQEARAQIQGYRRAWSIGHGGRKISLGNTLTAFGISIEESIEWRTRLLEPSRYLSADGVLRQTLVRLAERYRLVCVTNNPVDPARRTLEAIGVADVLPDIIGLDTCHASKPSPDVLEAACSRTDAGHAECLSVGDRYDIDLALPLELGMGAVLVDGVEDVYRLPEVIDGGAAVQD